MQDQLRRTEVELEDLKQNGHMMSDGMARELEELRAHKDMNTGDLEVLR